MRVNITDTFHNSSFATPLQAAGFRTALFGKYLNGGGKAPRYRWHLGCILLKVPAISLLTGPKYMCPDVPKGSTGGTGVAAPFRLHGWTKFFAMCPDDCYEDCLFVDDGVGRRFNDVTFPNGNHRLVAVRIALLWLIIDSLHTWMGRIELRDERHRKRVNCVDLGAAARPGRGRPYPLLHLPGAARAAHRAQRTVDGCAVVQTHAAGDQGAADG